MNKFLIVMATPSGPEVWDFESLESMAGTLMAMFRMGCQDKTATAWRRVRGRWEPMFPWQHGDGA